MLDLRPDRIFPRVTDIDVDLLNHLGIRGLLLDVDGTLMPTRRRQPAPEVLDWIMQMRQAGMILYVLSNNKSAERVRALSRLLGIDHFVHLAGKPRRRGYSRAVAETGLTPRQLAMVGDQIFTDVWGANRCGIWSFLVDSTDTDLWYQPLRAILEKPFMREKEKGT